MSAICRSDATYWQNLSPEEVPHFCCAAHDFWLIKCLEFGFQCEHATGDELSEVGREQSDYPGRLSSLRGADYMRMTQLTRSATLGISPT